MGISVLTLVKGRGRHLAELIAGLDRSHVRPEEVIVVDLSPQPLPLPNHRLRLIHLHRPVDGLPLAAARNRAAAHASQDRLLFLDVDCIPSATMVGDMTRALDHNDALICARVRYLPAAAEQAWTEKRMRVTGHDHPLRAFPPNGLRDEPNPGLFWSLAFGVRKATFDALGGFDERFSGYGAEDTDFGFRARAKEVPLLFQGGEGAFHQHHAAFDPPLNHFADIVRNARCFRSIWGQWPMEGWLSAFAELGLVRWSRTELAVLRTPTAAEVEKARQDLSARF